jgi:hypothetical protein
MQTHFQMMILRLNTGTLGSSFDVDL